MAQTDQTAGEVLDSLTGHDEMAISQHFGRAISDLIPEPGMYRRALIFALKRREGLSEDDARNAVLEMRFDDVLEFFTLSSDEDETPDESGKDEPSSEGEQLDEVPSEPLRVISPSSVS